MTVSLKAGKFLGLITHVWSKTCRRKAYHLTADRPYQALLCAPLPQQPPF
jgi:hypothetical protein